MQLSGTRRVRLALAIGLVAIVGAVVLNWQPGTDRKPNERDSSGKERHPGQEQAIGEETLVVVRDLEAQHIKAAARVTEPDGTIRMRGDSTYGPVRVTLAYTASGRQDRVTIQAAIGEYHPATQTGRFSGAVRVTTGLGVEVSSDSIEYRGTEQLARSEDVVQFKRKQVSGSAHGMTLAVQEGRLTLVSDVKMQIEDPQGKQADITAATGTFQKADGRFELTGDVTITQEDTVLTAERVIGVAALPDYALTQLTATGNVVVRSASMAAVRQMGVGDSTGSFVLRCKRLDMPLGADAARRELHAGPDGVDLTWHAVRRAGAARGVEKRLEANAATLVLDGAGRLEAVHATKNVRLTEMAKPGQAGGAKGAASTLECGSGFITLDPTTRQITRGELQRDLVMTRGPTRAVSENGNYTESELTLSGSPEVSDTETGARLTADTIQIGQGTKSGLLAAWGSVLHTFARSRQEDPARDKPPLMTISANRMNYDERKRAGAYRGEVLLRMGDDEISASQLQTRGDAGGLILYAMNKVRTRFTLRQPDGTLGKASEGRARRLVYWEGARRLRYKGSVSFRQGDLGIETPGELVAWLTPERKLQGLTAEGESVMLATGGRRATGTRLSYTPEQDALRLTGDPVTYEDVNGPGGRGLALTMYRGEDRMLLDGRDVQRTVTTIKKGQPTK